jgi:hypothetical protein
MPEPPTTSLPARDAGASARLLALADELAEHTAQARRHLAALGLTVERLAALAESGAAAPAAAESHQASALSPTARLIAVELALAGEPRDQVAGLLTRVFAIEHADAVLDDLYD